jgi:hypothetical protein
MQFSPPFCHFIPLGSKYSPKTLFSGTLSLCSSLSVRDQILHPYETTGKMIVLFILVFTLQTNDSEPHGSKHSPNLICS